MNGRIKLVLLILLLTPAPDIMPGTTCTIHIENASHTKIPVAVEIADTEKKRSTGLMHRRSLAANSGMLFVFPDIDYRNFWMKNTLIPLSIAYIAGDGTINEIADMKPLDISVTYPSSMPARYALEVNAGWFSRNGIRPGSKVFLHGCLGK